MSKAIRESITKPTDDGACTERQAKAYSNLEGAICDVANMATIAFDAVLNADGPQISKEKSAVAYFAVYHLVDMVRDLRRKYYAADRKDGGGDVDLVAAAAELQTLDAKIHDLHVKFGDDPKHDADERPDYQAASKRRRETLDVLATMKATSWNGLRAKAAALRQQSLLEDVGMAPAVAESLAEDIEALAGDLDAGSNANA